MAMSQPAQTAAGLFALAALIMGYLWYQDHTAKAGQAARQQRAQRVAGDLRAGPVTRSWQTTEGTVIEVAIPVNRLGDIVETKHCTVWRDKVTNTSAMACEQPGMDLGEPPQ